MNRLFGLLSLVVVLLLSQGCTKSEKNDEKYQLQSKQSAVHQQSSFLKGLNRKVLHLAPGLKNKVYEVYDLDLGGVDLGGFKPDYGGISLMNDPGIPSSTLTIYSVSVTGIGFTQSGGCGPGSYTSPVDCTFDFVFRPTEAKVYTGQLRVSYSIDGGALQTYGYNLTARGQLAPSKNPVKPLCGSVISPMERTVMEEIPVVGTDFTLQYNSRLAPEYVTTQGALNLENGFNQEAWVFSVHKFYDFSIKRLFGGSSVDAVDYQYSESLNQAMVVSPDGQEIYVFDDTPKHIKTLTALTGATRYEFNYDGDNRLEEVVDAYGNTTTISRNTNGYMTAVTAPYGQQTSFTVDGNGRLLTVTNPQNETYEFTYKSGTGLLATFKKPAGQVTTLTYDSEGHLIRDTSNNGSFWNFKKNSAGKIIRTSNMGRKATYNQIFTSSGDSTQVTVDPDLLETTISEEALSQNVMVSNVIEQSEAFKVDDERLGSLFKRLSSQSYTIGGMTSSTDFAQTYNPGSGSGLFDYASITNTVTTSGRVITSAFDNSTKTMTMTSPEGIVSTVKVDSHERPIETKLGSDVAVTFVYDANGRLSQSKQGSANQVDYTYNTAGYLETLTNNRSEQISYAYDLVGRVTQVTLPNLEVIQYQYDANGKLIAVTPPHKPTHWFSYNSAELLQTYKPATSFYPKSINYNMDKQITSVNNSGKIANYNYDLQTAKLSSIQTANGNYTYTYYGASAPGLLYALQSPYGVLNKFTYHGSTVASDEQVKSSDGSMLGVVSFDFDTDHRLTSRTIYDSNETAFAKNVVLNDDNQPTQVGDMGLTYDATSGRLSTTTINKITDSRTYDSHGNLQSYTARYSPTSAVIYSYTLTRDSMDRIVSISETVGSTTVVSDYTYNNRGWLTGVHRSTGGTDDSFTYDYNGNKTSQTVNGVTTTSVFDAEDRLTSFGSTTYAYDANGDLKQTTTSLGANSNFTYDVFGNLTQAIPTSGTTYSYIMDGQNRRVAKLVSGAVSKRYLYQDQLRVAAQLNASGVLQKEFIYATGSQTADYMTSGSGKYRIISNHLGSPRLVVNVTNGTIIQRLDYDVLGSITADTNPDFQPFGFAGGLYDQHTKLVRFGARDYDAVTGRWTTKDPILFAGGDTNLYGYVLNDPVNFVDHTGEAPEKAMKDGIGGAGGGGGRVSGGATGFSGRSGYELKIKSNSAGEVCGRSYSGHAFDSMQGRGITPSVVENAISTGLPTSQIGGTTKYFDPLNNLSVILNPTGRVITVFPGGK